MRGPSVISGRAGRHAMLRWSLPPTDQEWRVSVALVTGSAGLIGSEAVRHFAGLGLDVVGIDNDMRRYFFGAEASTAWSVRAADQRPGRRVHPPRRRTSGTGTRWRRSSSGTARDIAVVIHTAAQPSHDWAVQGAVHRLRRQRRRHAQRAAERPASTAIEAPFIHCSTNKVYGDRPNSLPLVELETRWEIEPGPPVRAGHHARTCRSTHCLHSVFGASKVAADVMVQEYGRYFDMRTACFRGGTLTGPAHSAAELHGFLGVPDALRTWSAGRTTSSATRARWSATRSTRTTWSPRSRRSSGRPRSAAVYNLGGGRHSNTSHIEAFAHRRGDHRPAR